MAALQAAWLGAQTQGGQIVPGAGEAGLGKSGLLRRLSRRLRGRSRVHVLVVEDLHGFDHRRADWPPFIGRCLALLPLPIVASLRDDPRLPRHPRVAVLAVPVPEPASWGLIALGTAVRALARRQRRAERHP